MKKVPPNIKTPDIIVYEPVEITGKVEMGYFNFILCLLLSGIIGFFIGVR